MVLELHELAAWVARVLAVAFVAGAAVVLASCSTGGNMGGTIADQMPTAIGGLPESAPQRPATPAAYPAVHNMPPPRASTVLTDQEQKKLEDELVAARNRAAATTAKPAGDTGSP